jgi:hypothetical protein
MKNTLDNTNVSNKGNKEYYGVIPCGLIVPIALFANKSDAEEYAKIFDGCSKDPSRMSNKHAEDYKIKKCLISF